MNRLIVSVITALLLGGCISSPPRVATAPASGGVSAPAQDTAAERVTAGTLLLEQGRAERNAGHYDDATTTIERALRIEPNNPELWLALGEIKLDEGDREQADLIARKALTLAGGDRSIEARAERLMRR